MSEIIGQTVAGYPIEKLLGKGSYGLVYQAQTSASPIAIKLLREDLRGHSALTQNAVKGWEAARAVVHPGLVAIFGANVDAAHGPYCMEEVVQGKSLRQMVLGGSKVAWRDCLIMVEQLFAAVQALHEAKLCHGDIWPSNILVTQDQDLKLEGAGALANSEIWHTDVIAGAALGYLAPEILRGSPISAASDLYSAGASVYFMLAGQDPFPGEKLEVVSKGVLERKPPPLSVLREDLPPEAEEFVLRLMAKDPTERYANAVDVLADVARMKSGQGMAPLKGGKPAPAPRTRAPAAPPPAPQPSHVQSGARVRPPSNIQNSVDMPKKTSNVMNVPGASSRVFGRLETHVKSTIPQSDTEKRGDDLYRQGQLPLALGAWRDAFENAVPHAALKAKIELAERDLKKEVYTAGLQDGRQRMDSGNFRAAISRAREAMVSAESEQQRQEAVNLEAEAIARMGEAERAKKVKLITVAGVFVVVVIIVLVFFGGSKTEEESTTPAPSPPAPTSHPAPGPATGPHVTKFRIPSTSASITPQGNWLRGPPPHVLIATTPQIQNAATMMVSELPKGTEFKTKYDDLIKEGTDKGTILEQFPALRFIDGHYPSAEIGYKANGDSRIHYFFLMAGPSDTLYMVQFEGQDETFNSELRLQMRDIMLTWTYAY